MNGLLVFFFFCVLRFGWFCAKFARVLLAQRMPRLCRLAAVLLLLLLCWVHCSLGYVEHRCTFDERMRKVGALPVLREVPRKGQGAMQAYTAGASSWEPIRIKVFIEDLKNEFRYCTAAGDIRPDYEGGVALCEAAHILTPEKKALLVERLIPESVQLHAARLLVRPMDWIFVGRIAFGACVFFTVPEAHSVEGVHDADFILYIAAGPMADANVAWGAPCSVTIDGRPVIGALNFGPQHISARRGLARAAAHEIAHALGFSMHVFVGRRMVTAARGVRGKPIAYVLSSRKTLQATRKHFNCATAPGMELEDEGGEGTAQSHWERRNAKDELMAGVSGIGYYSALTMAAFEDTGYYRANWGMEELMGWGSNSGCEFLEKKCVENSTTRYPDMFCTEVSTRLHCTSDHLALGICGLVSFQLPLAPQYSYFEHLSLGAPRHELTDYCPTIVSLREGGCTSLSNTVAGSRVGPNSRCLEGNALRIHATEIGAVCVEVSCESLGTVKIRHTGNDAWHLCPEGATLRPGLPFTGGEIVCPKYERVCTKLAGVRNAFAHETYTAQGAGNFVTDVHFNNTLRREEPPRHRPDEKTGDVAVTYALLWLPFFFLLYAVAGIGA
ncbi:putative surface protease GP63 [Trypanosoma rangeli]|uniref:Leishmanolysin-like peptidase n=1 Tax=Trypanosoma rangeli TaxID=5698 RepID=A0A3R7MXF4_TRYRA|nr:putative surface protease GP63 [Trypanosoma rangeli]RNE96778.1 putative surface protease GP63 [Trypanosoma rangeli]|eukprot:RNE96778.1 putative surface protease GP63 [Trypanosoma rangeli]